MPPAAPWQGHGTGIGSERTSVRVSKSGADKALGELSLHQGSLWRLDPAFSIHADRAPRVYRFASDQSDTGEIILPLLQVVKPSLGS